MPNETLCTDTSWLQQSIQYCLERKATVPYAKHQHSSNFHLLDPFFPQQLHWNMFNSLMSLVSVDSLTQGSVLAPLLFLFYINDMASTLNDDAVIALFANDVSILTTAGKRGDAEAAAQSVVNSVGTWSQEWKLEHWEKWGIPLLYLVKWQLLESNYLYWQSESLCQHHSLSPPCYSGKKLNI